MWLQCEECLKWRSVPASHYNEVPESWNCSQNPNPRYRCVFLIINYNRYLIKGPLHQLMPLQSMCDELRAWSGDFGSKGLMKDTIEVYYAKSRKKSGCPILCCIDEPQRVKSKSGRGHLLFPLISLLSIIKA